MTQAVTFITNKICPFAHRAWLTLLEKQVEFTFKSVNLQHKQAWFTQTYLKSYAHDPNSDGKVPILIHGNTILSESQLISWYVAQTFSTGTELIPKDTFQRAKMRTFIKEIVGKLIFAFYSTVKISTKTEDERIKVVKRVHNNLKIIEQNIVGPFVLGEAFTLADILLYPWFERWCVIEHYAGIHIPQDLIKIKGFIQAMLSRPSVQKAKSQLSDQLYIKAYKNYY